MGKITYNRGTTYRLTHKYTAPTYFGENLIFTVKTVENDDDATDTTNIIMTPKEVAMSGSSFPQTTEIVIDPPDVAVTVDPGTYFYSIKVFDSNGDEYIADSGKFILTAVPTNDITD